MFLLIHYIKKFFKIRGHLSKGIKWCDGSTLGRVERCVIAGCCVIKLHLVFTTV